MPREKILSLFHDTSKINEAFHIPKERMDELRDIYKDIRNKVTYKTEIIEEIWNRDDFTFEEQVMMTLQVGRFEEGK